MNSLPAIRASGVSKCFLTGNGKSHTVREAVSNAIFSGNFFRKSGEKFWALRKVSFELKKGEVLGIIGPNGSGKSTLLRILSGITLPTDGQVEINGRVISVLDLGTGFHPDLSGRENVMLSGAILGMKPAEISQRFNEIVKFSGIVDFIDLPVKCYSNGMFMRLAFSVATHFDADILLFDEVLAVGDQEFRIKCQEKILELLGGGKSVIIVSHDLNSVLNLCTNCIILEAGEIKAYGRPASLVGEYLEGTLRKHFSKAPLHKIEDLKSEPEALTPPGSQTESPFGFDVSWKDTVPAHGNELVHVTGISILDHKSAPITGLSMGEGFILKLRYQKLTEELIFPAITFIYQLDQPVMAVSPLLAQNVPELLSDPSKGDFGVQCLIPEGWLNSGIFSMNVIFFDTNGKMILHIPRALNFRVSVRQPAGLPFAYNGVFPGPFMPLLEWKVKATQPA